MTQFEIWRIAVDIGLAFSLLLFAVRFFRSAISSTQLRQVASLDSSLKGLIRDAEQSGSALNDQLRSRENSLKNLLGDFDSAQNRAGRIKSEIEQERHALEAMLNRVRTESQEITRPREQRAAPPIELDRPIPAEAAPARLAPREPEPVRAPVAAAPAAPRETEAVAPAWNEITAWGRVNIFGEPIAHEQPNGHTPTLNPEFRHPTTTLRSAVEKEVMPPVPATRSSSPARNALTEILRAAETMLRTGRSLESVATATRLPLDEVRRISQRMIREESTELLVDEPEATEAIEAPPADSRLGVLGGMKRQLQTV